MLEVESNHHQTGNLITPVVRKSISILCNLPNGILLQHCKWTKTEIDTKEGNVNIINI
jgi:hypothetical protein